VPVPEPLEDFELKEFDADKLLAFLTAQEFKSLVARVASKLGAAGDATAAAVAEGPTTAELDAELVVEEAALEAWIARARRRGWVAFDTETTSLDATRAELCGFSLAVEPGHACYVPVGHVTPGALALEQAVDKPKQIALDRALALIKPLLEDPAVLKIGHNIKYDMVVMRSYRVDIAPVDDTMVLSYCCDAGRNKHGLDELAELRLGHTNIKYSEVVGSGKGQISFAEAPLDKACPYAAEDADVTLRLHRLLKPRLVSERVTTVYEVLERPLIPVLVDMECRGVKVDADVLRRLSGDFEQRMAGLEDEIYQLAGERFNIGSPKQLGDILFDRMGLDGGKKTKTGAWGTGADVLETLAAQGHDLPARVLDWRQLSKLKSTYTDALVTQINPRTGRVHTSYAMAVAATGRLSSTDPNLQNIPVRTDEGRRIREAFVAEKGSRLVSLDYSQIELRLLAHVADMDQLKEAFRKGIDIHAMTASEVFGVPVEGMDPMVRRRAKAINFGIIYGISAFGLANQLRIDRSDAAAFIDAYFKRFPGIRDYMETTKSFARANGFVVTPFGRKIHVREINSKNPSLRGFAERQAINAPLQGGAADVIKRAMIRVPAALDEKKLAARMLLQVHDELLFEVPEGEVDKTIEVLKPVMETACRPAVDLSVPLDVDAGIGDNWAAAH
jgi:DNA polymerase-1